MCKFVHLAQKTFNVYRNVTLKTAKRTAIAAALTEFPNKSFKATVIAAFKVFLNLFL